MAMLLKNQFEIDAGLEQAWTLLTDLERIAPCMPGAALDGVEGDSYLGNVKVKVGPIGAHFRGTLRFVEKDDANYSAVISAAGKDPKGQAAASAKVHAWLEPVSDTRTRVLIDTDLEISGRMAQFGRGAIADVSNRLIGQFVANLSSLLGQPAAAAPAAAASTAAPSSRPVAAPAPAGGAGLDVMSLLLPMIRDRYGQALLGGLLGFLLSWLVFGRRVNRAPRYPQYLPLPPFPPDHR